MADSSEHADSNPEGQAVRDSLEQLDALLGELRENIGDPVELGMIIPKFVALVEGGLTNLAAMETGPEAKAKIARLRMQITELEQLLHSNQSILAGFSVYLKKLVEARGASR